MIRQAVIPAAGIGMRLRPHTFTCPKAMIPLANRPAIDYTLDTLKRLGVEETVLIVGYKKEELINYLESKDYGMKLHYVEQGKQLGIAHAIMQAKSLIKGPFIVLFGDTIFDGDLENTVKDFHKNGPSAELSVKKEKDPSKFGVVVHDDWNVRRVIEKPENPPSEFVITGFYIFHPEIFDFIKKAEPNKKGEYEITDAIQLMLDAGRKVRCKELTGSRFDVGRPEHLLEANTHFLKKIKPRNSGVLIGKKITGIENAEIGENATIVGPVKFAGSVSIGKNCKIGPKCEIKDSSIADGCEIKNTFLSGSMVQENSLIEYYGRVMESIIGKNCTLIRQVNRKGFGRPIGMGRKLIGKLTKRWGLKNSFFLSDESQIIIGQEKLDTEEFKKK